jgi:metallophosphoesterase (TIGR00282 family)
METVRILLLGDIVGAAGRAMFAKHIKELKEKHAIDAIIVNGENSSNQGRGITPAIAFKEHGAQCVTTGNHVWHRNEIYSYLQASNYVLRPANFPPGVPGVGVMTFTIKNYTIAVVNLQGRVFMREEVDDPFRMIDSILAFLKDKTPIIFIDFHAEATSEKHGLAYYCAGRVSGVVGTHTHVQTADERILPGGTAYITDLGMAGALNSMLGMQKGSIIQHFLTQLPVKFIVDTQPPFVMSGVIITVDAATGRAQKIERVRIIDEALQVSE